MEFIRLVSFEKSASQLFSENDILDLELALIEHPTAGDIIPRSKGLRKLRRPAKGHGKRGGARVIYYYVSSNSLIYLVLAYAKNEQEDLDDRQLKLFSAIIESL